MLTFAETIRHTMNIRENVKAILHQKGMTQVELAQKLGVSKQTIQAFLRGNVSVASLKRMAAAMDTTVENIVAEVPPTLKPVEDANTTATTLTCPHCGAEITILAH